MLSLAQCGFFPGSFFFHPFKFSSSQMRKGKINARVFLCFAFVHRVFEGGQDARRMNMMFDGGRGDGEHWCSHAGILRGLQSAHMIILMWCLRFHLLLNWHSHRWHLYSLRIKTSLFQCYPCYSCQGKPVAEERGLLSKNGFSAFSWPHTWFPPPGLPNPNLDPRRWQQLNRISCGKSYFPPRDHFAAFVPALMYCLTIPTICCFCGHMCFSFTLFIWDSIKLTSPLIQLRNFENMKTDVAQKSKS